MTNSRPLVTALLAGTTGVALAFAASGPAQAGEYPGHASIGHVYQVTNAAAGNAVQIFERSRDGSLSAGDVVATGGLGAGASLGSQGAAVLADGHLLVVNAGDDTISSFTVRGDSLQLRDVESTAGDFPTSVTEKDGVVYVLNAGSDTVTGLRLSPTGQLRPIQGSARSLSGAGVAAAQVQFDNTGTRVVVSERATNRLLTYPVGPRGLLGSPSVTASEGTTPFGFDIDRRNRVVVSEASRSTASSYAFRKSGLRPISSAISTTQAAACWVEIIGDVAFTTNAASNTISAFSIGKGGALSLLSAAAATTSAGPTDISASQDGRNLYVRTRDGSVDTFAVAKDGSLSPLGNVRAAASIGIAGLVAD